MASPVAIDFAAAGKRSTTGNSIWQPAMTQMERRVIVVCDAVRFIVQHGLIVYYRYFAFSIDVAIE
jgi:hypothetical protein